MNDGFPFKFACYRGKTGVFNLRLPKNNRMKRTEVLKLKCVFINQ